MIKSLSSCVLMGVVEIPASKSDSQRAILAAALAKGTSELENIGESRDEAAMLRNIERMGAQINHKQDYTEIIGIEDKSDTSEINIDESGLGLRLMVAVCSAFGGNYKFIGNGSIANRSHHFFKERLTQLGISVETNEGKLPIQISGKLHGGELIVDGSMSSQFLSGLLMALPILEEDSILTVHNLRSKPYVDMTIATLSAFGVEVEHDNYEVFRIKGGQHYKACEYYIESDWSSAANWLVASALGHEIRIKGLLTDSRQADKVLLNILESANCQIDIKEGIICVNGGQKTNFSCDLNDAPDLFPALVVLALFCEGESVLTGVHRLHNKESDRAKVLVEEFTKLGGKIKLADDNMIIMGGEALYGGAVDSHNDHRIAMALAIAATMIEGEVQIAGAEAVSKSYPMFWQHMEMLITQSQIPNP